MTTSKLGPLSCMLPSTRVPQSDGRLVILHYWETPGCPEHALHPEAVIREAAELRAREERELKAKEEAERRAKEEAELKAKEEAELRARPRLRARHRLFPWPDKRGLLVDAAG